MQTGENEIGRTRTTEYGKADIELSVIIAVRDPVRASPVQQLFSDYKHQIEKTGLRYEFIFVMEVPYFLG